MHTTYCPVEFVPFLPPRSAKRDLSTSAVPKTYKGINRFRRTTRIAQIHQLRAEPVRRANPSYQYIDKLGESHFAPAIRPARDTTLTAYRAMVEGCRKARFSSWIAP